MEQEGRQISRRRSHRCHSGQTKTPSSLVTMLPSSTSILLMVFSLMVMRCSSFAPSITHLVIGPERRAGAMSMDQNDGGSERWWKKSRRSTLLWLGSSSESNSTVIVQESDGSVVDKRKADDGRSDGMITSIADYYLKQREGENTEQVLGKRGNIQLVAGSGKTYIAWKVMERLFGSEVSSPVNARKEDSIRNQKIGLYVTPFLNLVGQALDNRDAHGILTNGCDGGRAVETMIIASSTSRKKELCTTDIDEIASFLTNESEPRSSGSAKILVSTYNSLPKIGAAIRRLNEEATNDITIDFAVFDEAHKMEGLITGHKNATNFAYGLYDSNIGIQNRLFMTGTPNNYTKTANVIDCFQTSPGPYGERVLVRKYEQEESSTGTEQNPKIRTFIDQDLFGPCLALKTHQESVRENITLPISLFCVETDIFREYDNTIRDSNGKNISEKDHYLPLAILSAFYKLKVKHAVSFHSTNQRARDFQAMAKQVVNSKEEGDYIDFFYMDHTTKPSQRAEILEKAREAPRSLISNCRLLSMGVDDSSWDLAVIADPVRSSVDGRQMIGRVGRKAPGKERGYVLVPMPLEEDLAEGTKSHAYEIFVTTFQHMVSLNPELRRDTIFAIQKSDELGRPLIASEYSDRLSDAFIFPRTMPLELRRDLMNHAIVEYGSTEKRNARWNKMFSLLEQYKAREGNCDVPKRHIEDGQSLGVWLVEQRQNMKKLILDKDFEERLTNIGVVWDPIGQQRENMFSLLEQYKAREGNCDVPTRYKEDEQNLGLWLNNQRQNKKKGILDIDSEERLTNIGVVWDPIGQQWEDMFSLLEQYQAREGDCNVPSSHQEEEQNLGIWLSSQRQKKNRGILDGALEERLTNVGVMWDPIGQQWEDMFSLLEQYQARDGDCNVPRSHIEDGQNLGLWLNNQRQNKKKGILDIDSEERLTNIGVVWDPIGQQWEDMFSLLEQYQAREGDCNVPSSHQEEEQNLGIWLNNQRQKKKKGILDKDYEERLTNIGVVWDVLGQQWENMFSLLLQYQGREGDCNVPTRYQEDGQNLGPWLNEQRQHKKKGTLDKDSEEMLTNIGVVWDPIGQQWENMFSLLLQYQGREGDCNVPSRHQEDDQKLGSWLSEQRKKKKKGILDKDYEERLTNAGVLWDPIAQQWEDMLALMTEFTLREGHCNVPTSHKEGGKNLGTWLQIQRQNMKKGKLSSERKDRLQAIGALGITS